MNPVLSFVTTCRGRLHHLRQTLPFNLAENPDPQVEFVVLDYDSRDGLGYWIHENFQKEMASGKLVYYRVFDLQFFHHAHAKNLVHLLAGGEFLCNLDADNFVSRSGVQFLLDAFLQDAHIICRPASTGRIAISRHHFIRFGGYDEDMQYGWGYEDNDFCDRVTHTEQLRYVEIPESLNVQLEHSDEERGRECLVKDIHGSACLNRRFFWRHCSRGVYVANPDRWWGYWPVIEKNFQEELPGAQVAIYEGKRLCEWPPSSCPAFPSRLQLQKVYPTVPSTDDAQTHPE